MKTAAYVLQEEQIAWLKEKAKQAGWTTASSALRRVLREAMEREGSDQTLPREALLRKINEN